MASQHFVVESATIVGLGHLQAAPYGCSKQLASESDHSICTTQPADLNVTKMIEYAEQQFSRGKIDDPANLKDRPIYVYAGGSDTVVNYGVCIKADELYSNWKAPGSVEYVQLPTAQHAVQADGAQTPGLASPPQAETRPWLT